MTAVSEGGSDWHPMGNEVKCARLNKQQETSWQ
jgi:hypothetical protein